MTAVRILVALLLALGAIGFRAVTDDGPPPIRYVIAWDGPTTSGRGPGQVHYVTCVDADDPDDSSTTIERVVDAADAYPVPDPVTGQHRYSAGQPCPDGPNRS